MHFADDKGDITSVAAVEVGFANATRKELHFFMDQAFWSFHSTVCSTYGL